MVVLERIEVFSSLKLYLSSVILLDYRKRNFLLPYIIFFDNTPIYNVDIVHIIQQHQKKNYSKRQVNIHIWKGKWSTCYAHWKP